MVSEIHDKSASKEMQRSTSLDEASDLLRKLAGNRRADESIKGVLKRVGRELAGWSHSRVRAVWYRDERVHLRASEIQQLRAIAEPNEQLSSGDALAELRNRVARLESVIARLESTDEAFHSPDLAAFRDQRRQMG